jgi:hypothetical protein
LLVHKHYIRAQAITMAAALWLRAGSIERAGVDAIALRLWNLAGIDAIWDDGRVMARTAFQLRMARTGWF